MHLSLDFDIEAMHSVVASRMKGPFVDHGWRVNHIDKNDFLELYGACRNIDYSCNGLEESQGHCNLPESNEPRFEVNLTWDWRKIRSTWRSRICILNLLIKVRNITLPFITYYNEYHRKYILFCFRQ